MQSIVDDCVKAKLNSVAYDLLCAGEDRAADAVYATLEHMTIAPSHREGNILPFPRRANSTAPISASHLPSVSPT